MVVEIRLNFQIRVLCAEKAISKITFNIPWNLKQIFRSWHTWVSKGNIKGMRTMGSEWPDKRNKTGFGSVVRGEGGVGGGWGGGGASRGPPSQLNSVGSEMVWVTGLFSLWPPQKLQNRQDSIFNFTQNWGPDQKSVNSLGSQLLPHSTTP